MGRIIFLSAVAYFAYKYIAQSNKKHQQLSSPRDSEVIATSGQTEVLPPQSAAAEPEPGR
jgi:hypothetical protein